MAPTCVLMNAQCECNCERCPANKMEQQQQQQPSLYKPPIPYYPHVKPLPTRSAITCPDPLIGTSSMLIRQSSSSSSSRLSLLLLSLLKNHRPEIEHILSILWFVQQQQQKQQQTAITFALLNQLKALFSMQGSKMLTSM